MSDPVSKAINILNDALARDPGAITDLVNMRVPCDTLLSSHPTIHTTRIGDENKLGVLGLLNGVLGVSQAGVIGAEGKMTGTGSFRSIGRFVDLRPEKLDILT